jgi:hypothetical protein
MRRLVILLVVLGFLAGIGVAGDFVARALAEREAEKRLQESTEISGQADVHIRGFPFLTQLARKRFTHVDIDGADVGSGNLQLTRFDAELRGVHVLPGNSSARVDVAKGTGFLSFADLQRESGRPGITVSRGTGNAVKVAGTVDILGQAVQGSVQSKLSVVNGDQIIIRATDLSLPGLPSSSDVVRAARDQFDFGVSVKGLPEGLHIVGVRVAAAGVAVDIQGQDVLLRG